MKAIPQRVKQEKDRLIAALRQEGDRVEAAVAHYNEVLLAERDAVEAAVEQYNILLNDARNLVEQFVADATDYFDARSERWQDGEAGQNYQSWISEWESLMLDDIEVDFPGDLDVPDLSAGETLETGPEEPEML